MPRERARPPWNQRTRELGSEKRRALKRLSSSEQRTICRDCHPAGISEFGTRSGRRLEMGSTPGDYRPRHGRPDIPVNGPVHCPPRMHS